MRDVRYDVQCIIDGQTGLIRCAACKCPAGAGGKCNHIAALLFAMLDFAMTMSALQSSISRSAFPAPQ